LAEAVEEADLIPAHTRRKPRKRRDESLPAHLPRQEVLMDVSDADQQCDAHGPQKLLPEAMWDRVERLKHIPSQLLVEVCVYPKYACEGQPECGIVAAERPTGLVEGDKYDTSIAAEIIANKYAYHLPVHRQQDLFAGSSWTPSRGTLLNILTRCDFIAAGLVQYFKQVLQGDEIVACDDTGTTLLYPKEPRPGRGFCLDNPLFRYDWQALVGSFFDTAADFSVGWTSRFPAVILAGTVTLFQKLWPSRPPPIAVPLSTRPPCGSASQS